MLKLVLLGYIFSVVVFCGLSSSLLSSLVLVGSSLTVSLVLGLLASKWLMCAMVLIFLGGMMVVFIYVSSVGNNEKSMIKVSTSGLVAYLVLGGLFLQHPGKAGNSAADLGSMFLSSSSAILFFATFYLLFVLFVSVSFSEIFKGTLNKLFY